MSTADVTFIGASDDARFVVERQLARERLEALRAAELAATRALVDDRDDDGAEPLPPPPPKHVRDPLQSKRVATVARQLGLPADASREAVLAAIDALSRAEMRTELRRQIGEGMRR